jgi:hypothetical protein
MDLIWQALILALFIGVGMFGLAVERRLRRKKKR